MVWLSIGILHSDLSVDEMAVDFEHIQAQCLHYHMALDQTWVKASVTQVNGPYMEGAKTGEDFLTSLAGSCLRVWRVNLRQHSKH